MRIGPSIAEWARDHVHPDEHRIVQSGDSELPATAVSLTPVIRSSDEVSAGNGLERPTTFEVSWPDPPPLTLTRTSIAASVHPLDRPRLMFQEVVEGIVCHLQPGPVNGR